MHYLLGHVNDQDYIGIASSFQTWGREERTVAALLLTLRWGWGRREMMSVTLPLIVLPAGELVLLLGLGLERARDR